MFDLFNPPPNEATKRECMSCRRYRVYRHNRYDENYSAVEYDAHIGVCRFCQKWLIAFKEENYIGGCDLWHYRRNQEETDFQSKKRLEQNL